MIFICLGTQIYPFDRLTKKIDEMVANGLISDQIFAQIGTANYLPKHYEYKNFISSDEFAQYQSRATLIIAHGGSGALIGALKNGKNVIAVPRLAQYGEHLDDHQLQIVNVLQDAGYLRAVYDMDDLGTVIQEAVCHPITKRFDKPSNVISIIDAFIQRNEAACQHKNRNER